MLNRPPACTCMETRGWDTQGRVAMTPPPAAARAGEREHPLLELGPALVLPRPLRRAREREDDVEHPEREEQTRDPAAGAVERRE